MNNLASKFWSFILRPSSTVVAVAALTVTTSSGVSGSSPAQAGSVPMFLAPASLSVTQGEIFNLSIMVDPSSQPIDAAQVYLDFDPAVLQVVDSNGGLATSVTLGPLLGNGGGWKQVLLNEVDNAAGRLGVAGGKGLPARGGMDASAEFVLATVRFKAVAAAAETQVTFDLEDADSLQRSKMFSGGVEVTGGGPGATLTITSTGAMPTPVPTFTPGPQSVAAGNPDSEARPVALATPVPSPATVTPTFMPAATPAPASIPAATPSLPASQTSSQSEGTSLGIVLTLVVIGGVLLMGLAVLGLLAWRCKLSM
jgi:hypothetical protein